MHLNGLARPYMDTLVTEMYRHVRLNDASVDWTWMELSVCSHSLSVALFLTWCLSLTLTLSLSHTHTHLNPLGLWKGYQTQASVQLDSLSSPIPPNTTEKIANFHVSLILVLVQFVSPTVLPTIICLPYFRTVRHSLTMAAGPQLNIDCVGLFWRVMTFLCLWWGLQQIKSMRGDTF